MKRIVFLSLALMTMILSSCEKPAGEGGDATIKGKVWVEDWDKNFNLLQYEFAGADEDVYIIYGDDVNYGDKISANNNGEFEFKYLRKGKYKIYVYSDQKQTTSTPAAQVAVVVEAEITSKKQTLDIGTITVKK
jgi:hypothetical protein